jgi:hypothetical protein
MPTLSVRGRPLIPFAQLVAPILPETQHLWWRFDGSSPFHDHVPDDPFPDDAESETLFLRTEASSRIRTPSGT